MKKFCSVLLSIVFALCLLAALMLTVIRSNLNYSKIINIAGQFLNPVMEHYLNEENVKFDSEFVPDVLASEELKDFVNKYQDAVVDYIVDKNPELTFEHEDVKKIAEKGIELYVKHTGAYVDKSNLDAQINQYVSEIISDLDTLKAENQEYIKIIKIVEIILSDKTYLICIIASVVLACLLLLINNNIFVWMQYVFMPVFVDGIILFVLASGLLATLPGLLSIMVKNAGLIDDIYNAVWAYISVILKNIKLYGIICSIAGIALWAVGFTLGRKKAS